MRFLRAFPAFAFLAAVIVLLCLAGALYVHGAGGPADDGSPIESFTVAGEGYWDGDVYKVAIGGTVTLRAACDCAELPDHTITITGPGWSPDTSEAGATTHSVQGECDTAGMFTAQAACAGGASGHVTIYVFRIQSVSIAKSSICAGAVASDVHTSDVAVRLYPRASYNNVAVSLSGGVGYTGGMRSKTIKNYGTVWYGGEPKGATLSIGGATFIGGTQPGLTTISVGADGSATGRIVSSNLIGEVASVTATVGTSDRQDSVTCDRPALDLVMPQYVLPGPFEAQVSLLFKGQAVDGHAIELTLRHLLEFKDDGDGRGKVHEEQWGNFVSGLPIVETTDANGATLTPVNVLVVPAQLRLVAVDVTALE